MSPNGSVLPANALLAASSSERTAIESRKAEHVEVAAGSDVQAEGNRNARGCLEAIASVSGALDVPVLAKETGGGLSRSPAGRA